MASIAQNKSILLVEEDREIALSIKLQLELAGFQVEAFTNPAMALDEYRRNPSGYGLVISDMKMISMSTFEFMRAVRAENSNSKILLITQFEIKPNEFSKVLPTSKVDGFVQRPLLSTRLVPSVIDILESSSSENLKP